MNRQSSNASETHSHAVMRSGQAAEPKRTSAAGRAAKRRRARKRAVRREVWQWLLTIALTAVLALGIRTFVFELVRVEGPSMEPTLQSGDMLLVTKFDYILSSPQRGDVVVCRYPDRGDTNFVKRIVGLPGDTVQIKDGYLYVNGVKYTEKFLSARMTRDYGPYTVPEGHYFVMGDNRNNSNDSRNSQVGAITRDMIIGHVTGVIWHQIPSTLDDWGLKTD